MLSGYAMMDEPRPSCSKTNSRTQGHRHRNISIWCPIKVGHSGAEHAGTALHDDFTKSFQIQNTGARWVRPSPTRLAEQQLPNAASGICTDCWGLSRSAAAATETHSCTGWFTKGKCCRVQSEAISPTVYITRLVSQGREIDRSVRGSLESFLHFRETRNARLKWFF